MTIWLEGEKAGESRFFRLWGMEMQVSPELEPLRTRVYIDGYNFYYGCLRGTPYKWLDLLPLFEKHILPSILTTDTQGHPRSSVLLPEPSIKFFTAQIVERVAKATDSVSSQARYHTALRKMHNGRIELVEGYYAVNEMKVKIVDAENPKLRASRMPRDPRLESRGETIGRELGTACLSRRRH